MSAMKFGTVVGLEAPVSRVVLGTVAFSTERREQAYDVLDRYVALGGNTIDTAAVYSAGLSEQVVGDWMSSRGVRERIVLIGKGAASRECTPELVTADLLESLSRLQTSSLDVYLMHRDNPDLPVSVFVDILNEHLRAGRVRTFGGSNWEPSRIAAANDYARAHGLVGFTASSPNFSLGVWKEEPWDNCCSASAPAIRDWYRDEGIALFAWSSQSGGFFTPRNTGRSVDTDSELVRVWFTDDNFRRLDRARELGREKGVSAGEIALAFVLCQPSNIFALIGPRSSEELESSMAAEVIELTADELAYVNLEV
jgi:aryl-alcohol dehydrogenase-like predicted oxidoreductase